jgi:choline dehydrogenase
MGRQLRASQQQHEVGGSKPVNTFDFIIVGAGSAGCVLADRLTANGRHRVLVLEAGPSDRRFWVQVPLGYGKTFADRRVNWMYTADPDPGLAGRTDYWPRGKVLGGSSSINAMIHVRGQPEDFDGWEALGNPGWGWKDVLPAFRALEDNEAGSDQWRGTGGPLRLTDATRQLHPVCHAFIEACAQAGLAFNRDFNGATQEGAGFYQITTAGGRRMSAARAFLHPAQHRANLKVATGAHVTRICFEGRTACGVEYTHGGKTRLARARCEVVLAAGAVNSPQLLQLSGVGPAALLRRHGIDVVHDSAAVGQGLRDHLGLNYTYRATVPTLNQRLRPWWGKLLAGLEYLVARRGPLSLSMNQCGGFFRTSPNLSRPNMQLYVQAITTIAGSQAGERRLLTPDPFPGFSLGLSSLRPTSCGFIEIRSRDPFAAPRIVANAYATDSDVEEMLQAVKFLRRLAAMPALAALIEAELVPGPECQGDEALIADIRQRSATVYHPVGTCRMGPDANTSVVDWRLKVHGLNALRIADASIFPTITSGNTNAPCLMVGWRAGELIAQDYP